MNDWLKRENRRLEEEIAIYNEVLNILKPIIKEK